MSRKTNKSPRNHTGLKIVLILLILAMIAATGYLIKLCIDIAGMEARPSNNKPGTSLFDPVTDSTEPEETEAPPETTMPEPEHVVSTATIASTGDVLMHMPVINSGLKNDGSYDFSYMFAHLSEYASAADYAAANLETTLCGTDNGYPYHGYPNFNCPDEIVDGLIGAGFDMMLTANNHSYDTSLVGYKRTIETVRSKGMDNLGTMLSDEEPKYIIKEINGINVGMLCYTYAFSVNDKGCPSLNGMPHIAEYGLCNYFYSGNLDAFYTEVENHLQAMEEAGAEATMMYIHWGVEYNYSSANTEQKTIAQKLCDLGIDVIVGGHPHVVQPIELLSSTTDPEHKTVCLYSMGNAVSNQRLGNISYVSTAHTEDGVLFSVTFEKYSDGTVYLQDVDLLPTWVYMDASAYPNKYHILPLDLETREEWGTKYGVSDTVVNSAQKSYDRTMAIVGAGLTASQEYLAQEKADREQYYYDLVFNPDKLIVEETVPETEAATEATE